MDLFEQLSPIQKALIAGTIGGTFYIFILLFLTIFSFSLVIRGFVVDKQEVASGITILFAIMIAVYLYEVNRKDMINNEKRKQIDLLIVLDEELNFLKGNLEAYKKVFSKPDHYPAYELWKIDTSLYFANLNHKINNEETLELKKNLMKIKDKIILINNFKEQARKIREERDPEHIFNKANAPEIIRKGIEKTIDEDIIPIVENSKKIIEGIKNKRI